MTSTLLIQTVTGNNDDRGDGCGPVGRGRRKDITRYWPYGAMRRPHARDQHA